HRQLYAGGRRNHQAGWLDDPPGRSEHAAITRDTRSDRLRTIAAQIAADGRFPIGDQPDDHRHHLRPHHRRTSLRYAAAARELRLERLAVLAPRDAFYPQA